MSRGHGFAKSLSRTAPPLRLHASRRLAPNGTVPNAGRQATARPVPASSPGVHSMIATRLEDVLAVEVPGDPQPPPTGATPATPRRTYRSAIARGPPARGGEAEMMDRRRFLLTSAGCWRGRIRCLNEPAPVPAAVGSRGPADQFDPRDDLRCGHVANRQDGTARALPMRSRLAREGWWN